MAPKRKYKSKRRFAEKALYFIAVYLVLFTIWQNISFLITGTEQTELINSNFTVIGLECGWLLFKRIFDKFRKNRSTEE